MMFRRATIDDIPGMQVVRNAVKENVLSNSELIKDEDYADYLNNNDCGCVCEVGDKIVGFSMIDLPNNNVWALFLLPEYEGRGIGKKLHQLMLDWYFYKTDKTIWLKTAPNTRAAKFYKKAGWVHTGMYGNELKFEMTKANWLLYRM